MTSSRVERPLQRDLHGLKGWAVTNHRNFNKRECEILQPYIILTPLGWCNPGCRYKLRAKDWSAALQKEVLASSAGVNMCPDGQRASCILWYIRHSTAKQLDEVIFALQSALLQPHLKYCVNLDFQSIGCI